MACMSLRLYFKEIISHSLIQIIPEINLKSIHGKYEQRIM